MSAYQPELGVSLHTVVSPLAEEHEELLVGTGISTIEVLSTGLFDTERPRQSQDLLGRMLARTDARTATVHCAFGGNLDLSSPDEPVRGAGVKMLSDSIALAAELQAPMVVVHASAEPIGAEERSGRLAQSRESLGQVSEMAARAGVRLAVELLPRTCIGNTPEELLELLTGLDEALYGVCLDVNHFMDRYAELPAAVHTLGDRLLTTHLSDYDGVDEKHWMPGDGVIDWAAFMRALGEIGYEGPFNYEAHPAGDTPEAKIADLEANFARLKGLVAD